MLYRRGDIWWVRFRHGGQRYAISTRQRDRRGAEIEARRIQSRYDSLPAHRAGRPSGLTLETLEALDLARVDDEGLDAVRRRTVEGLWRPMLAHWGERYDASTLTIGDVVHYVGERRRGDDGVRGQTVRREVQALVRALRVAKRDRLIDSLPFDTDDLPTIRSDTPLATQKGKLWSSQQIDLVLDHLSAKAITAGHRDRCRLIQLTGLRLEELHRLQPSWVVPTVGGPAPAVLAIPADAAKWGRARQVPLVPEALEIVTRCAPFPRRKPNKSLSLASKDAGLPGVLTPRDLRTWYLSQVGAVDPVAAQWVGGHSNIATTGLYLHSGQERATLAVVKALGGDTKLYPPRTKTDQAGQKLQ